MKPNSYNYPLKMRTLTVQYHRKDRGGKWGGCDSILLLLKP